MKHPVSVFLTLCISFFLLFVAKPAYAMEFRTSDGSVVIGQDERIAGSLFAAGDTVEINGTVDGDVYCAGKTIMVTGTVTGDVLCAGQTLRVTGPVAGSVRTAGQMITMDGTVGRNVNAFGQTVNLEKNAVVDGDAVLAGQAMVVGGTVVKGLVGAGDTISLDGTVDGDMNLAVSTLQVGENTRVKGKLMYESAKDAVVAPGAAVGTLVKQPVRKDMGDWQKPQKKLPQFMGAMAKPWPLNALGSIVTFILVGLVMAFLFPRKTQDVVDTVKLYPGRSIGIGILTLLVSPVIFLVLLVTIIGIPLAILFALFLALLAFLSKLFVALWVGREITSSFWPKRKENWLVITLIGVTLSWLLFTLPFVGWLIGGAAMLLGVGGIVSVMFSRKPAGSTKKRK